MDKEMQQGRWFNLGYWVRARDFSGAARELAVLLGRAAGLEPGLKILDAGFGDGAQLSVWLDEFRVERVVGIEIGASPAFAARQYRGDARIELIRGDAARMRQVVNSNGGFHCVVALDCAYHFNLREDFLRDSYALLAQGGRLALTDIVGRRPEQSFVRKCLFRLCGLPPENMYTREEYVWHLRRAGYENIRVRLLDRSVLGGFARFARRNPLNHTYPMSFNRRLKFFLTGLLLRRRARRAIFHYILVTAEKK